jgi:hypothetical protein
MRPLAEVLTELPAFGQDDGSVAGAPFEFFSPPRLPPQRKPRWLILLERLENAARGIAAQANVHARLSSIAENLRWMRKNIETILQQEFVLEPNSHSRSRRGGKPMKISAIVTLKFSGWFQCRLATNPDPSDEARGVSGFTFALPGEKDLDRIIRFQPLNAMSRLHCPPIGVNVKEVYKNGSKINSHPLAGANVDLLHDPKFVGENGIIAEYSEPIVPFHLCISKGALRLSRAHAGQESFPFQRDLFGKEPTYCPGEIGEATGIWSLEAQWTARINKLQQRLAQSHDNTEKAALQTRIGAMSEGMGRLTEAFFGKVPYFIPLAGKAEIEDQNGELGINASADWSADFWMGGWDSDALSGFVCGFMTIPLAALRDSKNEYAYEQGDVSESAQQAGHL